MRLQMELIRVKDAMKVLGKNGDNLVLEDLETLNVKEILYKSEMKLMKEQQEQV